MDDDLLVAPKARVVAVLLPQVAALALVATVALVARMPAVWLLLVVV